MWLSPEARCPPPFGAAGTRSLPRKNALNQVPGFRRKQAKNTGRCLRENPRGTEKSDALIDGKPKGPCLASPLYTQMDTTPDTNLNVCTRWVSDRKAQYINREPGQTTGLVVTCTKAIVSPFSPQKKGTQNGTLANGNMD